MTGHIKYLALNEGYDRITRIKQIQRAAKLLVLHLDSEHASTCPTEKTTGLPGTEMVGSPLSLLRTAQRMYYGAL